MPIDFENLKDLMQRTMEHLQAATDNGDQMRMDYHHNNLQRLNKIAEEATQNANAQIAKVPGTDNGNPAGLLPRNAPSVDLPGSDSDVGPQLPADPSKPLKLAASSLTVDPNTSTGGHLKLPGFTTPNTPDPWSGPDVPTAHQNTPFQGFLEGAANSYPAQAAKAVGNDAKSWMELPGVLMQKWYNSPEGKSTVSDFKQGAGQFFGGPDSNLFNDNQKEKAFGSVENANSVAKTLMPPVNQPREIGASENEHTLNSDAGNNGPVAYKQPEAIIKPKPRQPDDFNSRVDREAGKKPSMFTFENLIALLFGGPHAALGKYGHELSMYDAQKARIGSEIYKAKEGTADRMTQLGINAGKLALDEKKAAIDYYNDLHKQRTQDLHQELADLDGRRKGIAPFAITHDKESMQQLDEINKRADAVIAELRNRGEVVSKK